MPVLPHIPNNHKNRVFADVGFAAKGPSKEVRPELTTKW